MKLEAKRYKLRSAHQAETGYQLSGVVRVVNGWEVSFARIRFDESFIDAVGKKMPRGISPDDPAFLQAEYNTVTKTWAVCCRYLFSETKVVLKVYRELPDWIKPRRNLNGGKSKKG